MLLQHNLIHLIYCNIMGSPGSEVCPFPELFLLFLRGPAPAVSYGKSSASSLYAGSLLLSLFLLKFCPYSTVTSGEEGGGEGCSGQNNGFCSSIFISCMHACFQHINYFYACSYCCFLYRIAPSWMT